VSPLKGEETAMFPIDDLVQLAEELQGLSVDARYMILYGAQGGMEGLEVGDDFFPAWELHLPENRAALENLDFAAIKSRRGPDWSVEPPKQVRGIAV
jgi:hypothetical protein